MNNFEYYSPTDFVFGRATQQETGKLIRRYGGSRVLIVYGGGHVVRSGLLQDVKQSLTDAGVDCLELGGIQPNPLDDKVYEGISLARHENVDFLLAVGGGSVIDTAKAIAAGALYKEDFWDFYVGKAVVSKALPLGVVLTIPAAGSEGSGNSVITRKETMQKLSLRTPYALRPKFAIMNPELTCTLPAWQTAAGATDMLAHVMERYFTNTPGTNLIDRLGEGVMQAIIEVTPRVLEDPQNYDLRANLMWSGTMAHNGICGNGNEEDWASHFMEHEVSALYDVTHGAGLAVIFPAWLTWMCAHRVQKVAQWAERVWHVSGGQCSPVEQALQGVSEFKNWLRKIGMPLTFGELGIENPDIAQMVKNLHQNKGATVGNYVKLTSKDTTEIFRLALN